MLTVPFQKAARINNSAFALPATTDEAISVAVKWQSTLATTAAPAR
jgi:hypothetical protein